MACKVTTLEELKKAIDPTLGLPYAVLHEDSDIHLGFYAPGNPDPQLPHEQDEYYLVRVRYGGDFDRQRGDKA
jgi:hypothetical protein